MAAPATILPSLARKVGGPSAPTVRRRSGVPPPVSGAIAIRAVPAAAKRPMRGAAGSDRRGALARVERQDLDRPGRRGDAGVDDHQRVGGGLHRLLERAGAGVADALGPAVAHERRREAPPEGEPQPLVAAGKGEAARAGGIEGSRWPGPPAASPP